MHNLLHDYLCSQFSILSVKCNNLLNINKLVVYRREIT
ncbi:hypothetical protein SB359474_1798 [Shigella boydii 3594-74]|nr:hypothetical protein SB359474_1798 [Shigella boydii 3594-74]